MKEIPPASVKELAWKIRDSGPTPRFAFFLGAGASRQSDIITAGEMIRFFRESIIAACCQEEAKTDTERDKWLKDQDWYKKEGSEYSKLFEKYEPKEIGRQRYIERIIEGKEPSFGYLVLSNLIASNYVNTVITTNFDDLVFKACTSHAGIRPVVYAYGVGASELRIAAKRQKILKLHGDYLYSNLKNTDHEIAAQDPNMARQVSQVLNEYGLVVVGYSGGDESVMKILSEISEKNDLYWCALRGTEPNNKVQNLLEKKRGVLIEIDGFDEMMNEIGEIVGFEIPSIVEAMHERQNELIEKLRSFTTERRYSPKILRQLVEALKAQSARQEDQIRKTEALDSFMRAYEAQNNGNHKEATALYRKVIKLNPSDALAHNNLGWSLTKAPSRASEAEREYLKAIELDPNLELAYSNLSGLYQEQRRYDAAIPILRRLIEINPQLSDAHLSLGYSYLSKGDLSKAGEEFDKARRLNPKNYNFMLNIGLLRLLEGNMREATTFWKKGLEMCRGNSIFDKSNRALFTFASGQSNQGLTEMAKLIQDDRPEVDVLNMTLQDAEVMAKAPRPPRNIKKMIILLRNAVAGAKRRPSKR